MVKRIIFILVLFCASVSQAQDIHLTQWMHSPLNLNPGETGRFDGDYRIVGNFRSQWGAIMSKQFRTFGLSYDQNFNMFGQDLSAGLVFTNDRASIGNLSQNRLIFSAGYNKLYKGNYFSGGIQAGMLHKGINPDEYTYPAQWDNELGGFNNQGFSNNENFAQTNDYSMDLNIGFGWARQVNEKFFPEIGIAFFHINTPKESFLNSEEQFAMRQVFNAKLNYKINDKYVIAPNIMYMFQNQAQDMVYGAIGKMKIQPNKTRISEVFAGLSFRDGFNRNYDAANLILGAQREEWQVGVSYDINISNLSSVTHYRGAFELSVIYIAQSSEPTIYNVPCDRY